MTDRRSICIDAENSSGPVTVMPPLRRKIAVAAIYLGTFMATLAISIVTVALPAIQKGLGAELSDLQWVVGSYALCLSAFMLSAGPLGDRYGRKRAWLIGIGLFTLGSAICAAATSLAVLITGSALQGLAGALVIPGALSILTQAYPDPAERAHVIGGWSSFSAVSLILGPMLGGLLVDNVGWPSIFLVNLPLGALAFGLGLIGIAESADPDQAAFDPPGQFLSILFLGALTYALIGAGQAGWAAPTTLGALAIAALALPAFIVIEGKASRPVLPIDLFRNLPFASLNFASFALGVSGYSSLFFFSLFLQQAQGWPATQAGWRMAPVFAAMAVTAVLFGRLSIRYGLRRLMLLGYILLGGAMLMMARFEPDTSYVTIAPLFMLLGIGMGLAVPATSAAIMASAPRARSGAASATMNALRQGGMTIGVALLGTMMAGRAVATMAQALAETGQTSSLALAGFAVRRHEMPVGLAMAADDFRHLLAHALADGFCLAIVLAGLVGLAAALALVLALHVRARRPESHPALDDL